MAFQAKDLDSCLKDLPGPNSDSPLCVALSGGLDSTALLHALSTLDEHRDRLRALHVDHGLHPESADWASANARLCGELNIPFRSLRISVPDRPGESPEALARTARYDALRGEILPGELLLLAHHADDQAETVLLQLLRGAGPAGLAAMPPCVPFGEGWIGRPLLRFKREELERYAAGHGLQWVHDTSNDDTDIDRNFLRHRIMPLLKDRWPAATFTISRSARLCAEARSVMDEFANADLDKLMQEKRLSLAGLTNLPIERQRNIVRAWIRRCGFELPDSRRLLAIFDHVIDAVEDARPEVEWGAVIVRRYRNWLYVHERDATDSEAPARSDLTRPGESQIVLGAGAGSMLFEQCESDHPEARLCWDCLQGGVLRIGWRSGGERLRVAGQKNSRPLKKLLQEAGVVPWMRDRIPLVFCDDELVAVGDLWVCADAAYQGVGEAARVRWLGRPELF